jgi:hypothetical protein
LTSKQYVGQTTRSLARRWRGHVHAMGDQRRTQPVTAALRKYGPENFTMTELETCGTQEELNARELAWAIRLRTFAPDGYNLRAGGGVGALSDVARERLREAMTPARRQALSDLWRGRRLPDQAYESAAATRAARRRSWRLLDSEGASAVIENPFSFCAEQGMQEPNLRKVAWGLRQSHRGWRLLPAIAKPDLTHDSGQLLCPGCGDGFVPAMRRAAQTHATACVFTPLAVAEAIRLGHCTAEESVRALASARLGGERSLPDMRKKFVLVSPDGGLAHGVGVREFAMRHGLDPGKLSELINGKRKQYRGWRAVPPGENHLGRLLMELRSELAAAALPRG